MSRFVSRFAVGQNGLAYSAVWRVWTGKKKPDLYIAVRRLGRELKAAVHAPHPPHAGWERHFGFDYNAASSVSQEAIQDGGRHKVRWTGCELGPNVRLEWRVIIRGTSLEEDGEPVTDVVLLPMPSRDEQVEVAVILGPTGPTQEYPRERDLETHLIGEGRLSDGRRVWIVYVVRRIEHTIAPPGPPLIPSKSYGDPSALSKATSLRALAFGGQGDGSLAFWDFKATLRPLS